MAPVNNYPGTVASKYPGLRAVPHAANGGIGVSYSNIALGGQHPLIETGVTQYTNAYSGGIRNQP